MPEFLDNWLKLERAKDYKDEISSGTHKLYKLLTNYFPDADIACLIKIRNLIDNELNILIEQLYHK